jgi:hypothetical protein
MPLYSSVPMNIKVYSLVTSNRGIYWGPRPRVPWPDVHIFLGPRNILFFFIYNLCFSYLPGWGASKTDHTSNLYNNTYSFDTTRHKSMKICSLYTTIHRLHIKTHSIHTRTQRDIQLDHGAASLPMPPSLPSLDPPMFRTPLMKSRLTDEEGRLKT